MPAIVDQIPIKNKSLDRRYKLSDAQRLEIIQLYQNHGTYRGLARIFRVDRKTIKNIVKPDFYQGQLQRYKKEKHWQLYYDRQKNTLAMKKHRAYKSLLLQQHLITALNQPNSKTNTLNQKPQIKTNC